MWERRLLSAIIVAALAAVTAMLGARGYAVFLVAAMAVPVAMIGGAVAAEWLRGRRRPARG